jgi:hypothetical protein
MGFETDHVQTLAELLGALEQPLLACSYIYIAIFAWFIGSAIFWTQGRTSTYQDPTAVSMLGSFLDFSYFSATLVCPATLALPASPSFLLIAASGVAGLVLLRQSRGVIVDRSLAEGLGYLHTVEPTEQPGEEADQVVLQDGKISEMEHPHSPPGTLKPDKEDPR